MIESILGTGEGVQIQTDPESVFSSPLEDFEEVPGYQGQYTATNEEEMHSRPRSSFEIWFRIPCFYSPERKRDTDEV